MTKNLKKKNTKNIDKLDESFKITILLKIESYRDRNFNVQSRTFKNGQIKILINK
jgi:hypothetical protein